MDEQEQRAQLTEAAQAFNTADLSVIKMRDGSYAQDAGGEMLVVAPQRSEDHPAMVTGILEPLWVVME